MDDQIQAVTSKLTAVVRLVTNPVGSPDASLISAFKAVLTELDSIGPSTLTNNDQLGQMIMFPVFKLLQRDFLSDGLTEMVFKFMLPTFKYCWISSLKPTIGRQLFDVVLYLIGGPQDSPKQPSEHFFGTSDETRLAAVDVLQALYIAAIRSDIVDSIMASPMTISYNITILLNCIENSSHNVQLQSSSIQTLTVLCFDIVQSPEKLCIMLPGLMSTFTKLVAGKYGRPHYKVKASSYLFIAQLLTTVLADVSFKGESKDKFRTESWLKATKEQIKQALANISGSVTNNDRAEVWEALEQLYEGIIMECPVSLDNCLHICIDGIMKLASSDNEKVRQKAIDLLSCDSVSKEVKKQMEITFYDKIESLPRLLTTHDESVPLTALKSMRMMISSSSIDDESLIDPLIQSLTSSIQLKTKEKQINVINNEQFEVSSSIVEIDRTKSLVLFEQLGLDSQLSPNIQHSIEELLETIGLHSSLALPTAQSLFSQIMTFANQMIGSDMSSSNVMVPKYWILLALLKGLVRKHKQEHTSMDRYLNVDDEISSDSDTQGLILDILDFSTETVLAAGSSENYTMSNAKTVIPYVSISLELTGLTAEYLGSEFKHTLVETLYPVISMLSHPHPQVISSARRAMMSIARSCQYDNVRNLVVENVDYLLDGVSVRLNTLDITPQTPHLLSTFIELTGPFVVDHMNDIIDSLFVILDNFHGYRKLTEGIFSVFQTLIQQAWSKYDSGMYIEDGNMGNKLAEEIKVDKKDSFHIYSIERLIEVLNEKPIVDETKFTELGEDVDLSENENDGKNDENRFSRDLPDDTKSQAEESDDIESKPMKTSDEQDQEEWDSIIPKPTYMVLKRIMEYCSNFLIHSSSSLKYGLLVTIDKGIPLLASSRTQFLPLVNQYWPSIVDLLHDERIFVVEAAISVIGKTCIYSKDFMTGRIVNLWKSNNLKQFATKQKLSLLPKYSDQARLLVSFTNCLSDILTNTHLPPETFDSMLRTMIFHLTEFPELGRAFERINEDAVWLERYNGGEGIYTEGRKENRAVIHNGGTK